MRSLQPIHRAHRVRSTASHRSSCVLIPARGSCVRVPQARFLKPAGDGAELRHMLDTFLSVRHLVRLNSLYMMLHGCATFRPSCATACG